MLRNSTHPKERITALEGEFSEKDKQFATEELNHLIEELNQDIEAYLVKMDALSASRSV